ncbi:MAG: hypothetical protein CTY31_09000 [Hyphomicrobium sp.]|nr:MAG: hypothetical protein CTY39_07805 [Hyphomicrobium sp.]PPD00027.1 MAG: hypothetical protein CTY31_09000 [Hyphomicrobium sp.]
MTHVPPPMISSMSVVLHWLVAFGIIGMIAFGLVVSATPSGPEKSALVQTHKSFGMIVGTLALLRLLLRIREGFPAPIATLDRNMVRFSRTLHSVLLILTVALPITGILKSITYGRGVDVFGFPVVPKMLMEKDEALNELASLAHLNLAWMMVALLIIHAGAAVRHHFIKRDETLKRMLPGLRARP